MLMSALGKGEPDIIADGKKLYTFEQKVPIPVCFFQNSHCMYTFELFS